jgi:superoxide dismutase, Fe-Mn family
VSGNHHVESLKPTQSFVIMVITLRIPLGSLAMLAVLLALLLATGRCSGALRGSSNEQPAGNIRRELQLKGRLTGMQLVRADTDVRVANLVNGTVFNLSSIGFAPVNVNISYTERDIGSVRITSNVPSYTNVTESVRPYALCGNKKLDFFPCTTMGPGNYTITATPFTKSRFGSRPVAGTPITIFFALVGSKPSNQTSPSSNMTKPSTNMTTPSSNTTTPSTNMTTPSTNVTTPTTNQTTPTTNQTIPSSNRTTTSSNKTSYFLPNLTYAYDALEPFIDTLTMMLHHDKHHGGAVANLNKATENATSKVPLVDLMEKALNATPIRNNGGSHYNHGLFWDEMAPFDTANKTKPSTQLAALLNTSFGGLEAMKTKFTAAAAPGTLFGSGWVWLCVNQAGDKLEIVGTPNQDNPLMRGVTKEIMFPILGLDVWEHAYYLKHYNLRPNYVTNWWYVVNWDKVSANCAYVIANKTGVSVEG